MIVISQSQTLGLTYTIKKDPLMVMRDCKPPLSQRTRGFEGGSISDSTK